jgi:hypothetical protein
MLEQNVPNSLVNDIKFSDKDIIKLNTDLEDDLKELEIIPDLKELEIIPDKKKKKTKKKATKKTK